MDTMLLMKSQLHGDREGNAFSHSENSIQEYAEGNWTHHHRDWAMELIAVYIVIELLGTVGALTIIYTMVRSNTLITTYRVYLSLAAMLDILLLYMFGGNMVIERFTGSNSIYDVLLQSDISCRVYHVFAGFITQFHVWLHVAMITELLVMAVFPKKVNSGSSIERAHFLTLLIITVLLILNMNYFWTIRRQKEPVGIDGNELCYFDARVEPFGTKIYPVIEIAVVGVIPTMVWLALTLFTAKKFHKQGQTRPGGLLVSTGEYWRIGYSISTTYMLACLPRLVWMILKFIEYMKASAKNPGIPTLQNYHTQLIDGNPAFNLPVSVVMALRMPILVAASGSFRKELRKLCYKLCCCKRKYSIPRGLTPSYRLSSTALIPHSSPVKSGSKYHGGSENKLT